MANVGTNYTNKRQEEYHLYEWKNDVMYYLKVSSTEGSIYPDDEKRDNEKLISHVIRQKY